MSAMASFTTTLSHLNTNDLSATVPNDHQGNNWVTKNCVMLSTLPFKKALSGYFPWRVCLNNQDEQKTAEPWTKNVFHTGTMLSGRQQGLRKLCNAISTGATQFQWLILDFNTTLGYGAVMISRAAAHNPHLRCISFNGLYKRYTHPFEVCLHLFTNRMRTLFSLHLGNPGSLSSKPWIVSRVPRSRMQLYGWKGSEVCCGTCHCTNFSTLWHLLGQFGHVLLSEHFWNMKNTRFLHTNSKQIAHWKG